MLLPRFVVLAAPSTVSGSLGLSMCARHQNGGSGMAGEGERPLTTVGLSNGGEGWSRRFEKAVPSAARAPPTVAQAPPIPF